MNNGFLFYYKADPLTALVAPNYILYYPAQKKRTLNSLAF